MKYCGLLAVIVLLVLGSVDAWAQSSPTTRESEEKLKAQGLTKVGILYLLETDAKLEDQTSAVRKAQGIMVVNRRKRARVEQDLQAAENAIRQLAQERQDLNRQMTATKNTRKYNELVGEFNLRGDQIREQIAYVKQREQDLQKLPDGRDEYITQVMNLADRLEGTAQRYQELAKDLQVQETLSQINEGSTRKMKLGPSPRFAEELARWRKERASIDSAVIKFTTHQGVPEVEVRLNEKMTQPMVVDSGAAIVTITSDVAQQLGLKPSDDDPTIRLSIADGKEVEAKIVRLQSVRLAQFTVENVECAVLPASANSASCLLGGSFLQHFVYRMDLAGGALHMSQLRDPAQEKAGRPTTRPAAAGRLPRTAQDGATERRRRQ